MRHLLPPSCDYLVKTRLWSLCLVALLLPHSFAHDSTSFRLHFDEGAFSEPFTGDLFIAFSERGEPRSSMHRWFNAPPLARFEVEQIAPGEKVTLDLENAVARYPLDWSDLKGKRWNLQAVARVNPTTRMAGMGEGDVYGDVVQVLFQSNQSIDLQLNQVVAAEPFRESERIRLFTIVSPSLSEFHRTDYPIRAGVLLPREYDPESTYPTVYSIPGFGGTHESIRSQLRRLPPDSPLHQCIVVVPDPSNRYGHSVFCNSRSIGPWGTALVEELIPQLEEEFGGAGESQRYVTGVSSGGWSCLYLQITYPTQFAGCWSHVPDPIDFHDFQQINLYEPLPNGSSRNMYTNEEGMPRPLARRGDQVLLTYEEFVRREHVTNPGGQIRSFEATFSPPAEDGTPRRIFDIETGRIDHTVAQAWREYDLSHLLLTQWDDLKSELEGKIHIYAGEKDSFYLEGAVERFQRLAREAGLLDAIEVKVVPGMAHALYKEGHQQMLQTIAANLQLAGAN